MSAMRKLERQVIRNKCYQRDHNTRAFNSEWRKYHNHRIEVAKADGTTESKISRIKQSNKKKQRHADNSNLFIKQLKLFKGFIDNLKKGATEKRSELESKPVTE